MNKEDEEKWEMFIYLIVPVSIATVLVFLEVL